LGALNSFFEKPWSQVSERITKPSEQILLLYDAAFALRASGQPVSAIEPFEIGLRISLKDENKLFRWSAIIAKNLSELRCTLGSIDDAVFYAEKSVKYADGSKDQHIRMIARTPLGDALYQKSHMKEAMKIFFESEKMQKKNHPSQELLSEVPGFRFCDLLLDRSEITAWKLFLNQNVAGSNLTQALDSCDQVRKRCEKTIGWEKKESLLLGVGLDYLTLGRVALYAAILNKSKTEDCSSHLDPAVDKLRCSGYLDYLPRGLLTRAWLRFQNNAYTGSESAQEDLGEAWEIAERGPMKLFLADIHLYRARLFFREKKYPWKKAKNRNGKIVNNRTPKDDLDDAEFLIKNCGYHRRDEELADAKLVILGK
jgi:hypothetical protein